MRFEISQPPSADALDLAALKDHLRVSHADDDAALLRLMTAATNFFEQSYSVALISQQVTVWLHDWPRTDDACPWWDGVQHGAVNDVLGASGMLTLPVRPLISVDNADLMDDELVATQWSADNYRVTGGLEPRLVKKDGVSWPMPKSGFESIKITYTAGFGDSHGDVPMLISHGLMEMIAHLYTYRGDDLDAAAQSSGARSLWSPYKRVRL